MVTVTSGKLTEILNDIENVKDVYTRVLDVPLNLVQVRNLINVLDQVREKNGSEFVHYLYCRT